MVNQSKARLAEAEPSEWGCEPSIHKSAAEPSKVERGQRFGIVSRLRQSGAKLSPLRGIAADQLVCNIVNKSSAWKKSRFSLGLK